MSEKVKLEKRVARLERYVEVFVHEIADLAGRIHGENKSDSAKVMRFPEWMQYKEKVKPWCENCVYNHNCVWHVLASKTDSNAMRFACPLFRGPTNELHG